MPIEQIIIEFMRSPEFAPRRSIVRLYKAYFDRNPDLPGFDFWAARLASGQGTLEEVSQFFASSPEFQSTYGSLNDADFVRLVYRNVLGRDPDAGGFAFWTAQLAAGLDRGTMMTNFSESPEYVAATSAHVDVVVTYRGMLDRAPDPGGYTFWTGAISGDPNALATLVRGFYLSQEYSERVVP